EPAKTAQRLGQRWGKPGWRRPGKRARRDHPMKTAFKHLHHLSQQAMTVGCYLYGDSLGEHHARRYDAIACQASSGGRRIGIRQVPREFGMEPRDPLEITLLGGDRDEYIDKSFWHDAEAHGVTFEESRVDGVWDETSEEMWK